MSATRDDKPQPATQLDFLAFGPHPDDAEILAGGTLLTAYALGLGVPFLASGLALGRLDAVFLDSPIAAYYAKPNPKLRYAGPAAGEGYYGIILRKGDAALQRAFEAGAFERGAG